jgi:hypothetical protein
LVSALLTLHDDVATNLRRAMPGTGCTALLGGAACFASPGSVLDHPLSTERQGFDGGRVKLPEGLLAGWPIIKPKKPLRVVLAAGVRQVVAAPVRDAVRDVHLGFCPRTVGLRLGELNPFAMIIQMKGDPLPQIRVARSGGGQVRRNSLLAAIDDEAAITDVLHRNAPVVQRH